MGGRPGGRDRQCYLVSSWFGLHTNLAVGFCKRFVGIDHRLDVGFVGNFEEGDSLDDHFGF